MKIHRVLLVIKRTALEQVRARRRREEEALRRLLDAEHGSTAELRAGHEEHLLSVERVRQDLRARRMEVRERSSVPARLVRGYDLVVTVGGDGTLLEASHFVRDKTPVLGVNSAPAFSVGFLTGCRAPTFGQVLDALLEERIEPITVHRLQVSIGRRRLGEPVLNDILYCAENPAQTTRYKLFTPAGEEEQRSSGIWIATGAGSTAAYRSAGGESLPLESDRFAFVVREPYAPPGNTVRLIQGHVARPQTLTVECRLPRASLFVDGSHREYHVGFGERASFRVHPEPLSLVRPFERSNQLVRGI